MKFLSKPFLAIAMVAILAVVVSTASAADFSKPSAVISFGGYGKMIGDLNALGEATGQPGMGSGMDMMAKMMLQGIEVLDPGKPWGMLYGSGGEDPNAFVIFMPVSDVAKLGSMLKAFKIKSEKISDGYYKLLAPPSGPDAKEDPLYVKQQGGWIFGAPKEELLEDLPSDPAALLGGLDKKYLFAMQFNGPNGGMKMLEKMLTDPMQVAMSSAQMSELIASGKTPEEAAEIVKSTATPSSGLAQLGPGGAILQEANDQIETLTIGLMFDAAGGKMKDLQLDLQLKAIPGTDLAKEMGAATELASDFAGFYDSKAAIALNMSSQGTADMIEKMKQKVASFQQHAVEGLVEHDLNEDELETAKEWIGRLTKTIEATVEKGRLDTGFQLKYAPGASTALFGIKVVNGKECDEVVRQLSELLAKEEGAPASVTLDVGTVDGMKLHKVQPVPPSPIFGDDPEMVIGISDDAVYVGLGENPIAKLKSVIKKSKSSSSEKHPMVRASLDLPQLAKLINDSSPEGEAPIPEQVLGMLGTGNGNNVAIQVVPDEGGITYSLELAPSVIGTLFKSGMGNVMPMPGGGGGMPGGMPMMMPMPK